MMARLRLASGRAPILRYAEVGSSVKSMSGTRSRLGSVMAVAVIGCACLRCTCFNRTLTIGHSLRAGHSMHRRMATLVSMCNPSETIVPAQLIPTAQPSTLPLERPHKNFKRPGRRARRKKKRLDAVAELLQGLRPPDQIASTLDRAHAPAKALPIDWTALPSLVDPSSSALTTRGARPRDTVRFARKRRQAEAFAAAVRELLDEGLVAPGSTVVDFGCGSGNLVMALAAAFPQLHFVGVDQRRRTHEILRRRVEAANLTNLQPHLSAIEDYRGSFRLALGLHVCGEASDRIIMSAVNQSAAWVLSPCCIGSMNKVADQVGHFAEIAMEEGEDFEVELPADRTEAVTIVRNNGERVPLYGAQRIYPNGMGQEFLIAYREGRGYLEPKREADIPVVDFVLRGNGSRSFAARADVVLMRRSAPRLERPRSAWLAGQITSDRFAELASLADSNEPGHDRFQDVFYMAKTAVTLDRAMWAVEQGHKVELKRIGGLDNYAKDDLLVGCPPWQAGI